MSIPDFAVSPFDAGWRPAWMSLRDAGVYAFVAYCLGCLALTRWRMTFRRRWLIIGIATLAIAAIPAIGTGIDWLRQRRDAAEPIVVVARDVSMRIGNGIDYPAKMNLPRGSEVRRIGERNGWLHVETNSGALGWVPADAVDP